MASNFEVGSIIDGRYEILGVIGSGGMGCVYKGRQLQLDRMVAIKVPSAQVRENKEFLTRFLREARACAKIAHDYIVAIYDVHSGEPPYIVMEYVDGMPLNHFLHEQATTVFVSDLVVIIQQICEGLTAAHARGVIHRDIKPANIVITNGSQRVKIMDFGIARINDETALTISGSLMGTPYYMAPEQIRGEEVTPATDLYALAGIVYQLFTGQPVFEGELTSLIYKQVSERPKIPSEINPLLPKAVDKVLLRALDKNMQQRQDSPLDFCNELRMALRPIVNLPYSQIFSAARSNSDQAIPSNQPMDQSDSGQEVPIAQAEPLKAINNLAESKPHPATPLPVDPLAPTVPIQHDGKKEQKKEAASQPLKVPFNSPYPPRPSLLPQIKMGVVVGLVAIAVLLVAWGLVTMMKHSPFVAKRINIPTLSAEKTSAPKKTEAKKVIVPAPPVTTTSTPQPSPAPPAITLEWIGGGPKIMGEYRDIKCWWRRTPKPTAGQNAIIYQVTLSRKDQPEPVNLQRTLGEQYVYSHPLQAGKYRVTIKVVGADNIQPLEREFEVTRNQ